MPLLRGLPPQERPFPPPSPLPQGMSYAAFKIPLKPNIFSESSLQEGIPPPEEERNDCSRFLFLEHLKHCSVLALKGPGFKGLSVSQQLWMGGQHTKGTRGTSELQCTRRS